MTTICPSCGSGKVRRTQSDESYVCDDCGWKGTKESLVSVKLPNDQHTLTIEQDQVVDFQVLVGGGAGVARLQRVYPGVQKAPERPSSANAPKKPAISSCACDR